MTKNTTRKTAAKKAPAKKAPAPEPEAVEPEAVEPEAVEPEAVEPEAVEPEAVEPEAVEPEPRARRPRRERAPWPFDEPAAEPEPERPGRRARNCYALEQLVSEVTDTLPEVTYEVSNYDALRVALDVTFDLALVDDDNKRVRMASLLMMTGLDERVLSAQGDDGRVRVAFRSSLRTQDSREPFGVALAWSVLNESEAGA